MRITSLNSTVPGNIYVQPDCANPHIECSKAILDEHSQLIFFHFQHHHLCYDINNSVFINTTFEGNHCTNTVNNFECIMDRFFIQSMKINGSQLTVFSGTIHVFEEVEYQGYPVNAYFGDGEILAFN